MKLSFKSGKAVQLTFNNGIYILFEEGSTKKQQENIRTKIKETI
jgi:hypothetical protein